MTDYKQLCAELLRAMDEIEECEAVDWSLVKTKPLKMANQTMAEARTALDEPEPQRRYLYSPSQIAECGGPCQQGPEHCDCGELWVTDPDPEGPTDEELILTYAFAVAEAVNLMSKPLKPEDYKCAQLAGLRAVLTSWGNQ